MSDPHHILDADEGETAEEFLRRLSNPGPGRAPRAAGPAAGLPRSAVRRHSGPRRVPVVGGRGVRPWVAASASLLVWGGGQWVNGQRSLAVLFVTLQALAFALAYTIQTTWSRMVGLGRVFDVSDTTLAAAVFGLAGLLPVLWVAAVLQAYARATRGPKPWRFDGPAPVPALASLAVPGWGQLLNGQAAKGGFFLTLWATAGYGILASLRFPQLWIAHDRTLQPLAGTSFTLAQLVLIAILGLVWIVAAYDAFLSARHRAA